MQTYTQTIRTAVVTGGAQGIGYAIAQALAEAGCQVAIADINQEKGEAAAQALSEGHNVQFFKLDVSRVAECAPFCEAVAQAFGGIDIVINNAGILHSTPVEDITEAEWDRMSDINLKGNFFLTQAALPYLKKSNAPRVINMASLAGRNGGYGNGVCYAATKAGIIGLTQALARRLAPHRITVNAIAPGTTESDIIKAFTPERIQELQAMIPLGRLGKPEDIAALAAFLASEASGFITGAVYDINGGMFIGA